MLTSNITTTSLYAVKAKVELYEGSTLVDTCNGDDILQQITLERTCDTSKFFGYGFCQKINIKLLDNIKDTTVSTSNTLKIAYGDGTDFDYPFPTFKVTEIHKDDTKEISSITAYDSIHSLAKKTFADLGLTPPYTVKNVAEAISRFLGTSLKIINVSDNSFNTRYAAGANYEGTELLREVLDDIAEVTQTIYYIDNEDDLVFKRLDVNGQAVLTITKEDYYELTTKTNRRLAVICSATELGNNIQASLTVNGTTQYIRDNPFWTILEEDAVATAVDNALSAIGGLTINQFDCDWDGNYLLEIGDKINIINENDEIVTTYYLDDSLVYDGTIGAKTSWEYSTSSEETASNPTTIGEKLNQTFAKVDKINKEITLHVEDIVNEVAPSIVKESLGDVETDIENLKLSQTSTTEKIAELELTADSINAEVSSLKSTTSILTNELNNVVSEQESMTTQIASLQMETTNIEASVSSVEQTVTRDVDALESRVNTLAKETSLKVDAESVEIIVEESLSEGVDKVVTSSKNYTFDDDGLNISSSSSNISTKITENGMRIYRAGDEVLTADNDGVKAEDLHATTFLIIGNTSRLEDRENRTACFWIGD